MTAFDEEEKRLHRAATLNATHIVAARHRAEEQLLQAKEALERKTQELTYSLAMVRATLESTADGILVTSSSGTITGFNEKYLELWGIAAAELTSSNEHRVLLKKIWPHLKDSDKHLKQVEAIYATSPTQTFDVIELKDGRLFERVSKIQLVNGCDVGRVWNFRDITERRRAEDALREESRILELLNTTGMALASNLDVGAIVQIITDSATKLSGAKFGSFFYKTTANQGDVLTLHALSGVPREAFDNFAQPRATVSAGAIFIGEGSIRIADILEDARYACMPPNFGMPECHLPIRSYLAVPVLSRFGDVMGGLFLGHTQTDAFTERTEKIIVGMAAQAAVAIDNARLYEAAQREVEERWRAEEALRTTTERLRLMVESMPQKTFTTFPDGTVDYMNQQWMDYTNLSFAEMTAGPWERFVHPDDRKESVARWSQSISLGNPFHIEQRFLRADGVYRWHLTHVQAMRNANQQIVMWTGSSMDIDDLKQAAEERGSLLNSERAARAEAEHHSAMKDDFLAMLSHELRTPMSAILGWSQILRMHRTVSDEINRGLQAIERNAQVQMHLIEDLLDMSVITSGTVRLDIQPVDVRSFVAAAIETVKPAANTKRIKIEEILDCGSGAMRGDSGRLQQIVWNLLSNAIKFTPKDGKVRIQVREWHSHFEIEVADTGIGISPHFLPHIFDRFRQADASINRKFGGLGLGLAIVKHLVELHGGTVHAVSAGEGFGTLFKVRLPMAAPLSVFDERACSSFFNKMPVEFEPVDLSGIKVLVVDDEKDARDLLKHVLEQCRAQVLTVNSAKEAVRQIKKEKFDILISDIGMPQTDGYELLNKIRALQDNALNQMPAIALTAFARAEDRACALRAGFLTHVSKPIDASELVASVASIVGHKKNV